ncbi:hypothetical protein ACSMXN_05295 [Jatrophihabitans sp. DSM 45814]
MGVIIGMDPHKRSATIEVIDVRGGAGGAGTGPGGADGGTAAGTGAAAARRGGAGGEAEAEAPKPPEEHAARQAQVAAAIAYAVRRTIRDTPQPPHDQPIARSAARGHPVGRPTSGICMPGLALRELDWNCRRPCAVMPSPRDGQDYDPALWITAQNPAQRSRPLHLAAGWWGDSARSSSA